MGTTPNFLEELSSVFITKFQAIPGPDGILIIGMANDGWMYQFHGETGTWNRLSKAFPFTIRLPGSVSPISSSEKLSQTETEKT